MKRTMTAAIAAAVLLMTCPAYCGNTYYVATTGSNSNNGTTLTTPWQTINYAVGRVASGDTIYVRAGTYAYTASGTAITLGAKTGASATNQINLMGYSGERPLLDFSGMGGTSDDGLKITGSYWYVKGFDCKGAPHNGIRINGGTYNIVEFCTSYENRNTGIQLNSGAANNRILNCDSYYNCDSSYGNADGFSPKMDVGTGNYFYGCRSWQNSDDAYDGYLRGADDVTTTYENCWAFKAGYLKNGTVCSGNGNGFKMGGSDNKDLRHNFILKNCLSFSNKAKGFDQNSNMGSMTLYNCTAFSNGGYDYSIYLALASGKTATLTNCVSDGASGVNLASGVSWLVETTDNFAAANSNFVSVDPTAAYGARKTDGSLPDITFMHLAAGSTLINSGTDVGLPYHGSKPDLGCFEFPSPSPYLMTFATAPYGASATSVAMVATTATDPCGVEYMFTCTAGGGHSSGWQSGTSYTDTGLTPLTSYTYTVQARDLSSAHNMTTVSGPASATTQADTTPPSPSPMSFASLPYAASLTSISMVATTATDIIGVQYMFACTAGGGHDSAWQDGTSYTDTGLTPSTTYTYTVKARDKSVNHTETLPSDPASAMTLADTTAPMPNQMTWAVEPNATGIDTITMTAVTATDISGVEYFFANITDPNHNSTWQDSTTYTDTGLVNNTQYTYAVIARDKSVGHNENGWSDMASATTLRYVCTSPIASDLDGNCQVDFLDFALFGNTWAGDTAGWTQLTQFAADWLVCNRNPAGECWQ